MSVLFEGRVTAADRARDPYLELPFDVPPGTTRLTLRYRHDAGSVLDLGLFDPAIGPFPSERGFRGWSGGARDQVVVAEDHATPGYLPGPLPAGRWRVVLGLAAVASTGCTYRVEVDVDAADGDADADRASARPSPAATPGRTRRTGPGWYRGDLQSHTHHSDARGSLDDLRSAALARGLDFLAVTDHNTVSHHAPIAALGDDELLWVPGTEVTTYRGHANVWGVAGWVDFRIRSDADLVALVRHVHERGGLLSVNHPKTAPGCIGCDWSYPFPVGIDALEAWQGPWPQRNWESLERYDALLHAGRRVTLVGGSDRHQPPQPDSDPAALQVGSPTTWLHLRERSLAGVLDALRRGAASVSEGPEGPFLEIEVDGAPMGSHLEPAAAHRASARVTGADGETLRWVGAGGAVREVAITGDAFEDVWRFASDGPFLRAEVIAAASLGERLAAVRSVATTRGLPAGLDVDTIALHPYRLALSNPVTFGAQTPSP